MIERQSEITCRNSVLDLNTPKIMGILNVTPDSFSDGGDFLHPDSALKRIEEMAAEGAAIIDIGGESTRPGAEPVSQQEETDRILPVFEEAIPEFPNILFSVDTTKFEVARSALKAGAHIVNDVSGLQNEPRLAALCAEYSAVLILMHSQGDPKYMQDNPVYEDVIANVYDFFKKQLKLANRDRCCEVIIDPGIGFGKTTEHNLKLIAHLDKFLSLGHHIIVGASRKSLIDKILGGRKIEQRLAGTLSLHYHCLMKGASIIRVHDIQEANDSIQIYNSINDISEIE